MASQCEMTKTTTTTTHGATWWRDSHAKVTRTHTYAHTHSLSHGEEQHAEGSAAVPLGWMEEARLQRNAIPVTSQKSFYCTQIEIHF